MDVETHSDWPPATVDEPATVRMAVFSIVWAWVFYLVVNAVELAVDGSHHQLALTGRRLVVAAVGILLTLVLFLILRRFDGSPISKRLLVALTLSMPVAVVHACFNYYSFFVYINFFFHDVVRFFGNENGHLLMMRAHPGLTIALTTLDGYFFIAGWATIYIAFSTAARGRSAERQAAWYRAEAQTAQLRVLRYQLNPHFLFNTLNSLSTLILRGTPDQAERMIETLSAFLRTTLVGDPSEDTTLAEEIRVQRLYLDIEQVRFPDRLRVRIDIPQRLECARIPGLLLQPLVENAIRYGVAPTIRPVTVSVRAREEGGRLHLEIQDDGASPAQPDAGCGIGLRNVTARLLARFGADAGCTYGPRPEGGFRVRLVMPLNALATRS